MADNRGWMLVGLALAMSGPALVRGQALEELREDVRTSDAAPDRNKPAPRSHRDNEYCDDDGCDDSDDGWGSLLLFAIAAPFWGPPVWAGDTYSETGYFAHYPYQHNDGYMIIGPMLPENELYRWAARGRVEYGTNFGHLEWTGIHLLVETSPRFGLESDFRHIREDVPPGRFDSLWLGDANVVFRFAQSEYLVMRTGLGMNFLNDPLATNTGFNFTYGGDFFPARPWIYSGELDLGTLGHATAIHLRTTVGMNLGMVEGYLGYDYYDVGQTHIGGLVAGLRGWY